MIMWDGTNALTGGTVLFFRPLEMQGSSRSNLKCSSVIVSHCIIQVDPLLLKNHLSVNRLGRDEEKKNDRQPGIKIKTKTFISESTNESSRPLWLS